jgi:peptidoglycan/LPS O-acetylase OafA/YrhL
MNALVNQSNDSGNLAFIDALRGLAALFVVICHVGFIPNPALKLPELESRFVHSGHTGVILFFSLVHLR